MDRGRNLGERRNRYQKAEITLPKLLSFDFYLDKYDLNHSRNAKVVLQPFKQNLVINSIKGCSQIQHN